MHRVLPFIACCYLLISCSHKSNSSEKTAAPEIVSQTVAPVFNADSAYLFTQKQVDFGPRVPNTAPHAACADYFIQEFTRFGAKVTEQKADITNYAGIVLHARNIIASYQPENKDRVLLFAHWDTRPYADHDANPENWRTPIDGANDGASGCGVLLEVARQISAQQPNVGIDIILFDAEDWGVPRFDSRISSESGYCLGSKYWSKNPHIPGYTARYGILLDMVGAPNARFHKEGYSKQYAPRILNKVWDTAQSLGFGTYFINSDGGLIEDDHLQVIKNLNIPCIDIIQYDPEGNTGFGSYWHTLDDTMDNISKETLYAVGQTVLQVIYSEK